MMKKVLLSTLFIILFNAFAVKAQTNQSAPTSEDAINFINNVGSQNTGEEHSTPSGANFTYYFHHVTLKNCKLFIYHASHNEWSNGSESVSYICDVIDLSNVRIKGEGNAWSFFPNTPNAIQNFRIGKDNAVNYDADYFNELDAKMASGSITSTNSDVGADFYYMKVGSQIFIDNNYAARLRKACELLVKSCGGGRLKTDPNDKF